MKEMKAKARKLFAVMLSALMVLSLTAVSAFAANDGSITINNATKNQTYTIYKVFDATYSGDNIAYTYTSSGENDSLLNKLQDNNSPFTLTPTTTSNLYNVATTADAAIVSSFLKDNVTLLSIAKEETATSQNVSFTGLDYGYYYVASTLGATVTITSVAPSAEVQDKNQEPGKPDKDGYKLIVDEKGNKISGNSTVSIGDTVHYVLRASATNYDGDKMVAKYVAHDVLGAGLSGFEVTMVTVNDDKINATEYTVATSGLQDDCTAEIAINWVNKADDGTYTSKYDANSVIEIYCKAIVGSNATIGKGYDSNLTNTGWFTWEDVNGDDINPDPTGEKTKVTSCTYAAAIQKVDDFGNKLAGAEFTIAGLVATGSDGNYTVTSYKPNDNTVVPTTLEADDNGLIVISGLASDASLVVTETKAPDGYNKLTQAFSVQPIVTEETVTTTTNTTYYDADGKVVDAKEEAETSVTVVNTLDAVANGAHIVENKAGSLLPSTGGMGTTVLYVVGGLLIVGAGVALVVRRRMGAAE